MFSLTKGMQFWFLPRVRKEGKRSAEAAGGSSVVPACCLGRLKEHHHSDPNSRLKGRVMRSLANEQTNKWDTSNTPAQSQQELERRGQVRGT